MALHIKPGDLSKDQEFSEFISMLNSRAAENEDFVVCLEETKTINLSQFNALVKVYMKLSRMGKKLSYYHLHDSIRNFVDKTSFHHVFTS